MTVYIFFREGTFYPLELNDDADAIANAECNPGTVRVENAATQRAEAFLRTINKWIDHD